MVLVWLLLENLWSLHGICPCHMCSLNSQYKCFFNFKLSSLSLTHKRQAVPFCFTHHTTEWLLICWSALSPHTKAGALRALVLTNQVINPILTPNNLQQSLFHDTFPFLGTSSAMLDPETFLSCLSSSAGWDLRQCALLLRWSWGTLSPESWKWHLMHLIERRPG